mmetsp:Transcript_42342/g.43135  ORF Transcript_42342/g.43135 Transcript_42342/m.43135 type:complete len:97 (+) Transcript_42342:126-416(+)
MVSRYYANWIITLCITMTHSFKRQLENSKVFCYKVIIERRDNSQRRYALLSVVLKTDFLDIVLMTKRKTCNLNEMIQASNFVSMYGWITTIYEGEI